MLWKKSCSLNIPSCTSMRQKELSWCTCGKAKNNKILILIAGKHVRVWTGSCSAVLHRSPSLYSAYSSSFSSLTHTDALTDIFHLVGLRLGSNSNCRILLFDLQTAHGTIVLGKKKERKRGGSDLVFFALLLMHLLVFQGLSAKYRKRMCWVCMLLKLGQACFRFLHTSSAM